MIKVKMEQFSQAIGKVYPQEFFNAPGILLSILRGTKKCMTRGKWIRKK